MPANFYLKAKKVVRPPDKLSDTPSDTVRQNLSIFDLIHPLLIFLESRYHAVLNDNKIMYKSGELKIWLSKNLSVLPG
jgi:hypothetical protein